MEYVIKEFINYLFDNVINNFLNKNSLGNNRHKFFENINEML